MSWPDIVYVDRDDNELGACQLPEARARGLIHRVSRVFIFNAKGELLLQKRSAIVDVPNVWDQSAAGHVDEGESYLSAAYREMREEIGVDNVELTEITKFYTEETDNGVTKKRFNMLYRGVYDGEITVNPQEVTEVQWITLDKLQVWMRERPDDFTQGFLMGFRQFLRVQDTIAV